MDFPRNNDPKQARAIMGGYVYRGELYKDYLGGKFICGDYVYNTIFAVSWKRENNKIVADPPGGGSYRDAIEILTPYSPGQLITFGEDHNGEIYMGDLGKNINLQKLVGSGIGEEAPPLLSQTGAFKDLLTLEPEDGVIPYDMIEPFWSDGAEKYRWIAIPNDGNPNTADEQIQFSENDNWTFPKGTVAIKHFELGGKRLETRFEVKGDDNTFYYLTYKWNSNGTDATLLNDGLDEAITVNGTQQTWRYPSITECFACHQSASGSVLGLKTRYLNHEMTYPRTNINANQLITLSQIGLIDQTITTSETNRYLTLAAKDDQTVPLEYRARSYLDVNCSYCHQPATGNRANFDARITTALPAQNFINGAVMDALGIADARLIVPQVVDKSIVHYRIEAVGNHAMPPLAKNIMDPDGVKLIEDWINSIPAADPPLDLIPTGNASSLGGGCTELTSATNNQAGAAWYPEQIDLSKDLTIQFNLYLGNQDGADGAAFSFQRQGTTAIGGLGGGLGISGISPSLVLEFDTYTNGGEINSDHLAIWRNGSSANELVAPVCMNPACSDMEDGNTHQVSIQWNATTKTLLVYFDNTLRITFPYDIVQNVFSGNNMVTAGLSAGTGGLNNQHTVCDFKVTEGGAGTSPGLLATYFDGTDLTNEAFQRTDDQINFSWGQGSPNATLVGNDQFSVRWEGLILPVHNSGTQSYTFTTNTDDGVKLWVNGTQIIDQWIDQAPREHSGSINLTAGLPVSIMMEYYENGGGAVAQLSWATSGTTKQIIPASQFSQITNNNTGCAQSNNNAPVAIFEVSKSSGGYPLTTTFDARPSYDPDQDNYIMDWTFGDGQSGSGDYLTHTYNTPGTYNAIVTLTDNRGCTTQASLAIQVSNNQEPLANAVATPVTGSAPLVVLFDGLGSTDPEGDPLTYQWDFGDCTTRDGATATHTYNFAGTYQASLVVSDGLSTDTMSVEITVGPPPQPLNLVRIGNEPLQPTMISAKIYLLGPWNAGVMQTELFDRSLIPLSNPYQNGGFAFSGQESIPALASMPENVVDWVLVKVTDNNDQPLAQRACFVRNDGVLVDLDGTPAIDFGVTYLDQGKISIHHRNHLPIATDGQVDLIINDAYAPTVLVMNKSTGKYLRPATIEDNSRIIVQDNNGSDWFEWQQIRVGSYFYLRNVKTGKYFRPESASDGALMLHRSTNDNGHWTQWSFVVSSDGASIHLQNRQTGKYIRPVDGNEGANVELRPTSWNGSWTQWTIEYVNTSSL